MSNGRFVPVRWKSQWGIDFKMLQNPLAGGYVSGGFDKGAINAGAGKTVATPRPGGRTVYVNHTLRGSHNATRGAGAEAGLRASVGAFGSSILYKMWSDISRMNKDVADAIKTYGGVAICGRAYKMDTPNPEIGVHQAYYYDTYLLDAGSSIGSVFPASHPFVGPVQTTIHRPKRSISASKFPHPKSMPQRAHQHTARILVWAESANKART